MSAYNLCTVHVVQREIAAFITAMNEQRTRGRPDPTFLLQECVLADSIALEAGLMRLFDAPPPPALLQSLVSWVASGEEGGWGVRLFWSASFNMQAICSAVEVTRSSCGRFGLSS